MGGGHRERRGDQVVTDANDWAFLSLGNLEKECMAKPTGRSCQRQHQLQSWSDTAAQRAIVGLVEKVKSIGSSDVVPDSERAASFDNGGTLSPEHPLPFRLALLFDEFDRLAPQDREWKGEPIMAAAPKLDMPGFLGGGTGALLKVLGLTRTGIVTGSFPARVETWLASAEHPHGKKPYATMPRQGVQVVPLAATR